MSSTDDLPTEENVDFLDEAEKSHSFMETNDQQAEPSTATSDKDAKNGKEFVSRLGEYELMFKDRYTSSDSKYMERVEATLQPFIIHPFDQPQQDGWRGRGGGNQQWRDNRRPDGHQQYRRQNTDGRDNRWSGGRDNRNERWEGNKRGRY